jgi:small-conductance mechanosensitive channel
MLSLNFRNPADAAVLLPQPAAKVQPSSDESAQLPSAAEQMRQSVEVLLSPEAQKAAKRGDKNADIDATNLPDRIKDQLKMIRAIQERIAKRMQDMQAFMSDRSLSRQVREAKMRQLQMEIMAMNSSLLQATNQLNQAMQQMQLSNGDRVLAATLVGPQHIQS